MKKSAYSDLFQMHVHMGSFNEIYTCSVTDFGKFDFTSKLTSDAESIPIIHHPDTNALLTQLLQ